MTNPAEAARQGDPKNPSVVPRGSYGIDAPWVPCLWFGLCILFLVFGVLNTGQGASPLAVLQLVWFFGGAVVWFAGGFLYLYATRRGKFVVWTELLEKQGLSGTESALDIGCGRGAVTVKLALELPSGKATGIDLWRSVDQSGNNPDATRLNLDANGVIGRVTLDTGDMTALPYADETFDIATASISIHNVPSAAGRRAAITEALRVLKPEGKLMIVDIQKIGEYRTTLRDAGATITDDRSAGWRMWWSGPWMSTRILVATVGAASRQDTSSMQA